jgi:hypothetical protein
MSAMSIWFSTAVLLVPKKAVVEDAWLVVELRPIPVEHLVRGILFESCGKADVPLTKVIPRLVVEIPTAKRSAISSAYAVVLVKPLDETSQTPS